MYIVKGKITRPNTNIAFYLISDELVPSTVQDYWIQNYKDTGKCIHVDVTNSPDELELDTTQYWDSAQSYQEYLNDPFLVTELFAVRDTYRMQNGSTAIVISEETV
jgi:hypothetical protein